MKHKTAYYKCNGLTDATDKANLYYISSPRAYNLTTNHAQRTIQILNKRGAALAIFAY